jgi:hypothetical protein
MYWQCAALNLVNPAEAKSGIPALLKLNSGGYAAGFGKRLLFTLYSGVDAE